MTQSMRSLKYFGAGFLTKKNSDISDIQTFQNLIFSMIFH